MLQRGERNSLKLNRKVMGAHLAFVWMDASFSKRLSLVNAVSKSLWSLNLFLLKGISQKRLEEPSRMEATVELETLCIRVITWGGSYCKLVSSLHLICDCSWNSSDVVLFPVGEKKGKNNLKKKKKVALLWCQIYAPAVPPQFVIVTCCTSISECMRHAASDKRWGRLRRAFPFLVGECEGLWC